MNDDVRRGKFLARLRKDKNLKQSDLAKLIGYSNKSISKWERGECFPKDDEVLLKLSEIFDVSIEEILQGEPTDIEDNYKTNIKIIDYIIGNRKLIIFSILNLIILSFSGIFLFTKIDKLNDKTYLHNNDKIKINENDNKMKYASDLNDENNEINSKNYDEKEVIDNDKYSVLIGQGFFFDNFSYYKKLNDDVDIYFYTFNKTFKITYYDDNNELILITSSLKSSKIVIEKFNEKLIENFIIDVSDSKNCDIEVCDDYNDYAMYINYLKKLLSK